MSPQRIAGRSTNPGTLRPPGITVARHETFHLRDGWLLKALNALNDDPFSLSLPDAHHALGIGKNMLAAIRYWIQATGLAGPSGRRIGGRVPLAWTELAQLVFRHDPFLEDVATLWLLQLELASNRDLATFWYWAFNEYGDVQFADDDLVSGFVDYVGSLGCALPNERSVRKDVGVFLRTYRRSPSQGDGILEDSLDCPLAALGLIEDARGAKPLAFSVGAKSNLPLSLVAYATLRYRALARPGAEVISLDELRWAPHSPGRLLLLDTRTLAESIDAIEVRTEGGWLRLSHTAGLGNVHLGDVSPFETVAPHYKRATDEAA